MRLELNSEDYILYGIILVLVILASLTLFGLSGFRTIFGILALMFFPFYFILVNFDLSNGEKVIFSFFLGIMIFPSLTYLIGFAAPFRISIYLTFFILIASAFSIKKWHKTS